MESIYSPLRYKRTCLLSASPRPFRGESMMGFPRATAQKRWHEYVFGTEWKQGKTWSVFIVRISLGFTFLWSGYQKVLIELSGQMATKGFLSGSSVAGGPFASLFNGLAGNWTVEYLVVGGELAIGFALVFGTLTRLGTIAGMLQMALFTVAMWPIQDTPSSNPIFDTRTFYIAIFLVLFFARPGMLLGGDAILHQLKFVQKHPRVRKIMNWIA